MDKMYKIPWQKYGIISYLAKEMKDLNVQFGKTSVQKMIYILQEIYKVNIGYKYILYNYGPYSPDLASDLDYIAALDGVEISWVNSGGYDIKPGRKNDIFIEKSSSFIEENKERIEEALKIFGKYNTKELELRATIIYIIREYDELEIDELAEKVHNLKPYFSAEKVKLTVQELQENGCLSINKKITLLTKKEG